MWRKILKLKMFDKCIDEYNNILQEQFTIVHSPIVYSFISLWLHLIVGAGEHKASGPIFTALYRK